MKRTSNEASVGDLHDATLCTVSVYDISFDNLSF